MRKSGRTREAQKSLFYFFEEISDIKHEKILRLSLLISTREKSGRVAIFLVHIDKIIFTSNSKNWWLICFAHQDGSSSCPKVLEAKCPFLLVSRSK